MKVLAICHDIAPLESPQAIQIGRQLAHLPTVRVDLVSGGAEDAPALEAMQTLDRHLRVPEPPGAPPALRRIARLTLPLVGKAPDGLARWRREVLDRMPAFLAGGARPDVLASFGEPMSDHMVAMELKRTTGLPWLAHFSDPWARNPFRKGGPLTRARNAALERSVVAASDVVVVTSEETRALFAAAYPNHAAKLRVIGHAFDRGLFPPEPARSGPLTIAHIGSLYGDRTPYPLLEALRGLSARRADLADRLRVRLVGPMPGRMRARCATYGLPVGLVAIEPPVRYRQSLGAMLEADILLIIDAPAETSVFLPSKLIDYLGSGRPVLAITPAGAAADVVRRMGGATASPGDPAGIARMIERAVDERDALRRFTASEPWGDQAIRGTFDAPRVAAALETALREAVGRR